MQPIKLEILLDDKTLAGMKSVEGNIVAMEAVTKQVIDHLKLQLKDLEKQYKVLQKQGLAGDREMADIQAMQGAIGGLKDRLKELQKAKQQTNETPIIDEQAVIKQTNSLKMQFSQVARELPALAMGPQMFILAISNNLPYLADAIKDVRVQNEALSKSGQKATPVWKQLLSAAGSWQTMLVIGITLLTVYGKEIWEWTKGLFKAKDATLDLLTAEQEMAQVRGKVTDSIKKERAELDILYTKLKNASTSTKERTSAANEWIKRYPEYANILSGENINLSKLEYAYKALSKEIYANAVARNYTDKIADISVKKEKEEIKRLNQKATLMKTQRAYDAAANVFNNSTGQAKNAAAINVGRAKEELEQQQKIYDDIVKNIEAYGKNITTISNHIQAADLFPQPQEGTYDYWKQQQERAESVLKEIKSNAKKTLDDAAEEGKDLFSLGIDKSVVETYKQAIAHIKEAKQQLKVYDGKDGKASGGNDKTDYQTELADARLRAQKKLEAALVQIEQEGYEKRRRQKELEYNDELDNISKQEQKLVKVLDNAKKNGKPVTSEDYKQVHNDAGDERSAALMIYKNELEKINKEASSAEREKLEEYAKQFQGYIAKRTSTEKGFDTKRGALQEDEASDETLAELDYQKNKALEEIDYEFASREIAFQTWAGNVVNLSLEELQRLLVEAEKELEREEFLHPNDAGLASKRAKVKTLQGTLTSKTNNSKKGKEDDPKRSMKEWAELNSVLGDVEDSFSDIGGTVGDVAGDIIKTAGTIATSTLRIIDGITTLSENAAKGIEGTSAVAAKSLSAVEKASVILAIISAAMQAVTAIAGLFKRTDYMEEFRKEMAKLNYELELTKLNAEISTDKKNIFGDDLWANAVKNVTLAHEALNRYNNTLDKIASRKKYTGFLGVMAEAQGLKNTYDSLGDSIANMQLKIRHKTWFRSAKYSSLKDAVPELFNADGSVNQSALEQFIGSDTFGKLSQENQQYLQEMSDYWKTYQETVEQVKDYLSDIFGDLGGTLTDTLVDAWVNGTDAAESYCNSVSDMLEQLGKQMIYSAVYSDIFEKAQQKMLDVTQDTDLSADQKFQEYIKLLGGMTDEVMDKQDGFSALLEAYQKMAADKGFDLFKPEEESSSQSGRAGAITTVTEETGGKLEGIGHSIQTHVISMDDKLTDISKCAYEAIGVLGKIAENTAYCKYLEQLADDSAYQRREGTKLR